jgi:S1-C subfamily serine protease
VTTRQVAVPLVAAVLGSALTAAGMVVGGGGSAPLARQQGLLASGHLTANDIYERAAPGVVFIRARSVQPGAEAFQADAGSELAVSTGSGFVVDDSGHVVTNAHVVNGVTAVQVTFPDGPTVPAHVLGKDQQTDLAVLAVNAAGLDLHPLELGDSGSVRPGDPVVAVGNPTGLQVTAGTGRIAAAGREVEAPGGVLIDGVFETDAVIEPATSGGPLIGGDGRVVGITSRMPGDDGATAYAVPADTVRDVLGQIEETGKVVRPYAGLRGTPARDGVHVTAVYADGPAARAGIHSGDVIEAIQGRRVRTLGDLFGEIDRRSPGQTVELRVMRNGSRGDVKLELVQRPATTSGG